MTSPMQPERILRVEAPHFTAGAIWRGKRCIAAAPIIKWMVGADPGRVKRWLEHHQYPYTWHWAGKENSDD